MYSYPLIETPQSSENRKSTKNSSVNQIQVKISEGKDQVHLKQNFSVPEKVRTPKEDIEKKDNSEKSLKKQSEQSQTLGNANKSLLNQQGNQIDQIKIETHIEPSFSGKLQKINKEKNEYSPSSGNITKDFVKKVITLMIRFFDSKQNSQNSQPKQLPYDFFYSDGNPDTLVMLSPLNQMPLNLIRESGQSIFFWLEDIDRVEDSPFYTTYLRLKEQLQIITKLKTITVIKTFEQLIQQQDNVMKGNNKQKIVVFTVKQFTQNEIKSTNANFYIFLPKDRLSKKLLLQSSKLSYVYIEQDLINKLKEHKIEKQLPNFLYVNPEQVSTSNRLVRVIYSMLKQPIDKQVKRRILEKFGELLMLMAERAHFYYTYQESVKRFVEDTSTDSNIIKWYTSESTVYKVLNNLLRSARSPAEIYYVQPFFKSLYLEVNRLFRSKVQKDGKRNFKCYRGAWLTQLQIEKLKSHKGSVIFNLGFISSTLKKKEALNFGNCIIEIEVEEQHISEDLCAGYANIEEYSCHPNQRQVLFNPLNSFLIVGFYESQDKLTIQLRYGVMAEIEAVGDKNMMNTFYCKFWLEKVQKSTVELKMKRLRQINKIYKLNTQTIQCQGETFLQGKVFLQGGRQYWNKYEEIIKQQLRRELCSVELKNEYELIKYLQMAFNMWNMSSGFHILLLENKQKFGQLIVKSFQKLKIMEMMGMEKDQRFAGLLSNLGSTYHVIGEIEKAEVVYQQTLSIYQKYHQADNVDYLSTLQNLGNLYFSAGNYDRAMKAYEQIKLLRKRLRPDQIDNGQLESNLANIYFMIGKYEKAKLLYEQLKEIRKFNLGIDNVDYGSVLMNLANIYTIQGQYEKSIALYEEAKKVYKNKFGDNHLDYATVLVNLGNVFEERGENEKALQAYAEGEKIRLEKLGEDHPDYASILINLGSAYRKQRDNEQTIKFYEKARQIYKKRLGVSHIYYGKVLGNLAICYSEQGQVGKAMTAYIQSQQIFKKNLGALSFQYNRTLFHHSLLYQLIDSHKYSGMLLECRPNLLRLAFSKNIKSAQMIIAESSFRLSKIYQRRKLYKKLLVYSIFSLKQHLQLYGEKHKSMPLIIKMISKGLKELGNRESETLVFHSERIQEEQRNKANDGLV